MSEKLEIETDKELSLAKRRQLKGIAFIMSAGRTSYEVEYLGRRLQAIAIQKRNQG